MNFWFKLIIRKYIWYQVIIFLIIIVEECLDVLKNIGFYLYLVEMLGNR